MNTLSIIGSLTKKNEKENIENKAGKKWIKQTFVINTESEYNNEICFQLFGEEKVKLLEKHNLGDKIEVFFNIYSKEYNNRYYHNIDAWRIESKDSEQPIDNLLNENQKIDKNKDDLPF